MQSQRQLTDDPFHLRYCGFPVLLQSILYWPICPPPLCVNPPASCKGWGGCAGKAHRILVSLPLAVPFHLCERTKGKKSYLLKAELVCWQNAHLQVRNCLSRDKGTDCLALSGSKHSEQSGLCCFLWEITLLNTSEYQEVGFLPWVFNLKFSLI